MHSPADAILQGILAQQMRIGVLVAKGVAEGKPSAENEIHVQQYSDRLDGLIFAFTVACPNWHELCENSRHKDGQFWAKTRTDQIGC